MNELIQINAKRTVTAKELYQFLGLRPGDFARWCKVNIEDNPFAVEGKDWVRLRVYAETPTGGCIERIDYELSVAFAKKLCMLSRSEQGERARDYFLEVERQWEEAAKKPFTAMIPQTFPDALRLAALEMEGRLVAEAEVRQLTPRAEFADAILESSEEFDVKQVADMLAIKGMGRNNLFRFLIQKGILIDPYSVYRDHIELKRFRIVAMAYEKPGGEKRVGQKVVATAKGIDFIRNLLQDESWNYS